MVSVKEKTAMPSNAQRQSTSKASFWGGRIISALVILFMLFDASIKLLKLPAAVEGSIHLGFPAWEVFAIGLALLISVALYIIPRTSIVGAILLTAYLGGATAAQVRLEDRWFVFPVLIGMLVWLGPFLRHARLRDVILGRVGDAVEDLVPKRGQAGTPGSTQLSVVGAH
jgi:hypothetical protein